MQGHGYTQPVKEPPPTGWLVFLRVFFVVLSVLSFGLLMWVMMLRLAIVTRRALDWCLFVASILVEFLGLYLMGSEPGDEIHTPGGWTGLALVMGGLVASIAYYLSADIRHFHQLRFPGYATQRPPAPAYGYPQAQAQSPYTATTVPQSRPTPQTPVPQTPVPQPPMSRTPVPPPPQRPAPARIDQVRAELDELSDYLRQHDGRQDGNPEGGR
ncbi:hypothetical protein ABZ078_04650 [Streptomyces sp. NPDC006385]|uniref:hypothetical protein n=1 Tax=Streptomyces sp. NPDC006385 TaxID=3156761 RepID=UPI0033A683FB